MKNPINPGPIKLNIINGRPGDSRSLGIKGNPKRGRRSSASGHHLKGDEGSELFGVVFMVLPIRFQLEIIFDDHERSSTKGDCRD